MARKEICYSIAALGIVGGVFGLGVCAGKDTSATPAPVSEPTKTPEPTQTPEPTKTVVPTVTPTPVPNCEVNLLVLGFRYLDNPVVVNNEGHPDPVDYVIGKDVEMGSVAVSRVINPTDANSGLAPVDTMQMESHGDFASALRRLRTVANVGGGSAVKLSIAFEDDKPRVQDSLVALCGKDALYIGGRYASESEISAELKNTTGIDLVGARAEAITRNLFGGRSPRLLDQTNNPALNRANLRANAQTIMDNGRRVRAREQQAAGRAGIK